MSAEAAAVTARIVAFLREIGITVTFVQSGDADLPDDTFLPGLTVRAGGLLVDQDRLSWPGDLLHDAGHIAVTDPALRSGLDRVSDDPAEEMAAIAWSYAAACALDLEPAVVFHAGGYAGGGQWLADAFAAGTTVGQPMLRYWGMTSDAAHAGIDGRMAYPAMARWLR